MTDTNPPKPETVAKIWQCVDCRREHHFSPPIPAPIFHCVCGSGRWQKRKRGGRAK